MDRPNIERTETTNLEPTAPDPSRPCDPVGLPCSDSGERSQQPGEPAPGLLEVQQSSPLPAGRDRGVRGSPLRSSGGGRVTEKAKRNSKFEWQTAFIQSGLTGNTGFVGLLMSTLDNGDGRGFFVSAKSIESWSGMHERTARTQIKKLMEVGWIVRTSKGGRRGQRVLASTYHLAIPADSNRLNLSSQPGGNDAQPDDSARPLDQVSLDPLSLDPPSLDLSLLVAGQEVPWALVEGLEEKEQRLFVPSFFDGGLWVYAPGLDVVPTAAPAQVSAETTLSSREERLQRNHFVRTNRDEGLDQFGESLQPRQAQPRYRFGT